MLDNATEEMISAYLDGEVSDEERRQVDALLSQSVEARALLSQLRRQRAAWAQLPRWPLSAGVYDRVMREVQRRAVEQVPARTPSTSQAPPLRLVSAALAVAAALVLAFLDGWSRQGGPGWSPTVSREEGLLGPEQFAGEWSEESFVYYLPGSGRRPTYSLLIDASLTEAALRAGAFRDVLSQSGIDFDPDLRLDRTLNQAVLSSRFLADVEELEDSAVSNQLEIIYLVCAMEQVDEMVERMVRRRNEFPAVKFDLIDNPDDLDVMYRLNSASRAQLAGRVDTVGKRTLAHRLVLSVSLRSTSIGFLGTISAPTIRSELVPVEDAPLQARLSNRSAGIAATEPAVPGNDTGAAIPPRDSPAELPSTDQRAELVVVLRTVASD